MFKPGNQRYTEDNGRNSLRSGKSDEEQVLVIFRALRRVLRTPSPQTIYMFYLRIIDEDAILLVDALLARIRDNPAVRTRRLFRFAHWMASHSPDREPVKFAIAILGLSESPPLDVLTTLGQHEEFTLSVSLALGGRLARPERNHVLWRLARSIDQGTRKPVAEHLLAVSDPEIKAWLVRRGYRSPTTNASLAHACAVGGGLLGALRQDAVDDDLLLASGEILAALFVHAPGPDIPAYADGVEATRLHVDKIACARHLQMQHLLPLRTIKVFVEDEGRDWDELQGLGWTPSVRQGLSAAMARVFSQNRVIAIIRNRLTMRDRLVFEDAARIAEAAGIDPWDYRLERQRSGLSREWRPMSQTRDRARMARLVQFALEQFRLVPPTSGATLDDFVMAPFRKEFVIAPGADFALSHLVYGLERFPGLGWPLVEMGLRSSYVENRQAAVRALVAWGRDNWPGDVVPALRRAIVEEPDPPTRVNLKRLLWGRPVRHMVPPSARGKRSP